METFTENPLFETRSPSEGEHQGPPGNFLALTRAPQYWLVNLGIPGLGVVETASR